MRLYTKLAAVIADIGRMPARYMMCLSVVISSTKFCSIAHAIRQIVAVILKTWSGITINNSSCV